MVKLWNKYKEKFHSGLFESTGKAVGGILVVFVIYTLLPSVDTKRLENMVENYVKTQSEMGKKAISNIKERIATKDSLILTTKK